MRLQACSTIAFLKLFTAGDTRVIVDRAHINMESTCRKIKTEYIQLKPENADL